jgi:hypothetical protein
VTHSTRRTPRRMPRRRSRRPGRLVRRRRRPGRGRSTARTSTARSCLLHGPGSRAPTAPARPAGSRAAARQPDTARRSHRACRAAADGRMSRSPSRRRRRTRDRVPRGSDAGSSCPRCSTPVQTPAPAPARPRTASVPSPTTATTRSHFTLIRLPIVVPVIPGPAGAVARHSPHSALGQGRPDLPQPDQVVARDQGHARRSPPGPPPRRRPGRRTAPRPPACAGGSAPARPAASRRRWASS